jgi:predicted RNA-binding Zn ribbon-like protein
MDIGYYADWAAELVNADLSSVESLQSELGARDWLADQVSAADLKPLRRFQADIRAVVASSAAGDEQAVVQGINALLDQHPLRPQISGHDASSWHLHINDATESVADILIGEALFGMTLAVTELGTDRWGWCADPTCGEAYYDGTANHSKRFCCTRCATRTNVAAYRQRKAELG